MIKKLEKCRVSGSTNLISVVSLGNQALTGIFPQEKDADITAGPLELVWCPDSGLLQLAHSYDASEMYGENYGYRSGLNQSMVSHLTKKIATLEKKSNIQQGDVVLDIGSNDATSLKAYSVQGLKRIGIDPTGDKFRKYYTDDIKLIPDFFSSKNFSNASDKRAKIITSIAMFYDLEDPILFAQEIAQSLDNNGMWHFEQSYMPSMLRMTSYDTICHEHLEYYSLEVVKLILKAADLEVIDVQMNAVNGGSFAVTAGHCKAKHKRNDAVINWLLEQEERMGLKTPRPYREFNERTIRHREDLRRLLVALKDDGKKVIGYGASTKGNAVLQYCEIGPELVQAIAEVNPDKYNCFTPGTHIPIISEAEAKSMKPDYFLVLPWHFKEGIIAREQEYLSSGGKLILPFPEIEII